MVKKYADIHVKVDSEIKAGAEEVLGQIGISLSDLINMTLRRVIYERDIPFETCVGNEFDSINSREELEEYLTRLVDEDDGTRIPADEVWAEMDEYIKNARAERRKRAKEYSRRDVAGLLKNEI